MFDFVYFMFIFKRLMKKLFVRDLGCEVKIFNFEWLKFVLSICILLISVVILGVESVRR